eukprot:3549866-Rhodomonas_salina.2
MLVNFRSQEGLKETNDPLVIKQKEALQEEMDNIQDQIAVLRKKEDKLLEDGAFASTAPDPHADSHVAQPQFGQVPLDCNPQPERSESLQTVKNPASVPRLPYIVNEHVPGLEVSVKMAEGNSHLALEISCLLDRVVFTQRWAVRMRKKKDKSGPTLEEERTEVALKLAELQGAFMQPEANKWSAKASTSPGASAVLASNDV